MDLMLTDSSPEGHSDHYHVGGVSHTSELSWRPWAWNKVVHILIGNV